MVAVVANGTVVVVAATVVVVVVGTRVVVETLPLDELWVTRAVIPTAASATMATIATIIHPLRRESLIAVSSSPSLTSSHVGIFETLQDRFKPSIAGT